MTRDHHLDQVEPEFDNEGRDSDASHQATRRILLGPIGAAFALLLVAIAAIGATAIIAGSAQ